jgi:hypothetical protein
MGDSAWNGVYAEASTAWQMKDYLIPIITAMVALFGIWISHQLTIARIARDKAWTLRVEVYNALLKHLMEVSANLMNCYRALRGGGLDEAEKHWNLGASEWDEFRRVLYADQIICSSAVTEVLMAPLVVMLDLFKEGASETNVAELMNIFRDLQDKTRLACKNEIDIDRPTWFARVFRRIRC